MLIAQRGLNVTEMDRRSRLRARCDGLRRALIEVYAQLKMRKICAR